MCANLVRLDTTQNYGFETVKIMHQKWSKNGLMKKLPTFSTIKIDKSVLMNFFLGFFWLRKWMNDFWNEFLLLNHVSDCHILYFVILCSLFRQIIKKTDFNVTLIKKWKIKFKIRDRELSGIGVLQFNKQEYVKYVYSVRSSPLSKKEENGNWNVFFYSRGHRILFVCVCVWKTFSPVCREYERWGLETLIVYCDSFSIYSTVPNIYRAR